MSGMYIECVKRNQVWGEFGQQWGMEEVEFSDDKKASLAASDLKFTDTVKEPLAPANL